MYKIIRLYFDDNGFGGNRRLIKTVLTLEEAQSHCQDPETSSSSCTNSSGKVRTRRLGQWFDAYEECNR